MGTFSSSTGNMTSLRHSSIYRELDVIGKACLNILDEIWAGQLSPVGKGDLHEITSLVEGTIFSPIWEPADLTGPYLLPTSPETNHIPSLEPLFFGTTIQRWL